MIKYKCQCGEINQVPNNYPYNLALQLKCSCGQKVVQQVRLVNNPIEGIDVDKEYELIQLKQSKLSSAQRAIIIQMKG